MSETLKPLSDAGRANYERIFSKRPTPAADLANALGKRFFENGQLERSPHRMMRVIPQDEHPQSGYFTQHELTPPTLEEVQP